MKRYSKTVFVLAALYFSLFVLISVSFGQSDQQAKILKFKSGDTLEEIRSKIKYNGYNFKVARNWVFDMSPERKEEFLNRRAPVFQKMTGFRDEIGPLAKHLSRQLPSSFDWRNHNGHSYIGPVRDQGNCGSCYAFAACAAAEGAYNYMNGLYDASCADFSEADIAFCLSNYYPGFDGCDGANYNYDELTALIEYGVVNEDVYPYQDHEQLCGVSRALQTVTFESWHRVPCGDTDAIKTAIMTYGVVDAAVMVTGAFMAYSSGVYEDANTSCNSNPCYYTPTNHAIALVGWDDNPPEGGGGCWILRNSWGTSWGGNGYMRIRYGSARTDCEVCYIIAKPSPTPTPAPVSRQLRVISPRNDFKATRGENTFVSVSLSEAGIPITNATVAVWSSDNAGRPLTLLDNGESPDTTADDGIYSGNWIPVISGNVTLKINASGFGGTLTGTVSGFVFNPGM